MSQATDWGVPRNSAEADLSEDDWAARADISFDAILSSHKGSSAPTYAVAGTVWIDDTGTPWIYKVYDGTDWIEFAQFNATANATTFKWAKGADVASATALTLGTDGNYFDVTGTTDITSISTVGVGTFALLQFDGVLTLTHHATDLITPTGANIVTSAGSHALVYEYAAGDWRVVSYFGSPVTDPVIVNGRLTLTTATPVTTSDVGGAATIYFTPYMGNTLKVYSGSIWKPFVFSELSLALSGGTANKPHDVFVYDNSGTLTLEILAWTDDTNRATALVLQDGVYVKSGAPTRLFLGTIYLDASKQCSDTEETRHVWNMYNRRSRPIRRHETTNSWTYTTLTWRQANGSTSNRISLMAGLNEDAAHVQLLAAGNPSIAVNAIYAGIGLDSTTAISSDSVRAFSTGDGTNWVIAAAGYSGFVGLGRHELTWLEKSAASGTTTWLGDNGTPLDVMTGMVGSWMS